MLYNIGNLVQLNSDNYWNEGSPYTKTNIYKKSSGAMPPVNYDSHTLKPHSLTHVESARHTLNDGQTLDILINEHPEYFYGDCVLMKFDGKYKQIDENIFVKEITLNEILSKINELHLTIIPPKILITTHNYPIDSFGYHKQNYVLILSLEAAKFISETIGFNAFGTSWKSSDYQPNSADRPIHNIILSKGVIYELLNLNHVPEGRYTFSGMPLYLQGASESPVTPILVSTPNI